MVKVSMLSTGEEVLHGDIVDTNASWLSELFFEQGFAIHYRSTVGDQLEELESEITALSLKSDVVIVNGGLGPTTDDLSALAAAKALGVELELNQEWLEIMTQYFARLGRPMAASNDKQAMLPVGAEMINNPVGTACGFSIELNNAVIFFTPGVPFEFKRMTTDELLPRLKQRFPNVERLECNKIYTFGLGESGIADRLKSIKLPDGFSLGYRSYMPFIEVKIFSSYQDPNIEQVIEVISGELAEFTLSINQPLIASVGNLLEQRQTQISALEQVTGGEVARSLSLDVKAQEKFVQSVVDNKAQPLSELQDALLIADEYRQDTQSDIVVGSFKMEDESIALVLISAEYHFAQQVSFTRTYPLKSQQILLSTLMLDMVRRYLQQTSMLSTLSHFERLAFIEG